MIKQKLNGVIANLKKWSEAHGDETLDGYIKELEELGGEDFETNDDTGSNPPGGPSQPPGTGPGRH